MTTAAVRAYFTGLLTPIYWPYGQSTDHLRAFGVEPDGLAIGDCAFILMMRPQEHRTSIPRAVVAGPPNGGLKRVDYEIDLLLNCSDPSLAAATARLDTLEAVVKAVLRVTEIDTPPTITDPVTGETSRIIYVGEDFETSIDWAEDESDDQAGGQIRAYRVIKCKLSEQLVNR